MSVDTRLHNTYLIAGEYDPAARTVVEKTAFPVVHQFFTRLNYKEHTLVATDERGMLCSIDNTAGKLLKRINDTNLDSLLLHVIPPGIARQSYFAFDKEWQNKLIENARLIDLTAPLRPIPVTFTAAHMRTPQNEGEKALLTQIQGLTCRGQLIPRMRMLVVLIDKVLMGGAPSSLHGHLGQVVITLYKASSPVMLAVDGGHETEFLVYSAAGPDVKEGTYVVKVPADSVASSWQRRDHASSPVARSFQAAFGVHTLFSDLEIQVLDLPSLEDAILTHFAERYSHLLVEEDPGDRPKNGPYAQAESALVRFRSVATVLNEKRKMAVGFVNADASMKARLITAAGLGAIAGSGAKGTSEAAGLAASMISQAYQAREVRESWKNLAEKMLIREQNAAALGLVEKVMDGNAIKRFFVENKWRETVVSAIQEAQKKTEKAVEKKGLVRRLVLGDGEGGVDRKKRVLGRYVLWAKSNANQDLLKKLTANAMSPQVPAFESAAKADLKLKALWALDTAVTVKQVVETIKAISELHANEEVQASRLHKHMEEYGKQFGTAPCTEAIRRLEVLRQAADAASTATDEKIVEAVEMGAKLTLRALSLVPVTAPFAEVATLTIETLETLGGVADLASDAIDRFVFRHRGSVHRFAELAKLHALQCRAIAKEESKKHDDPHTQFRLRMIVLIGLLRLIERCGSKAANEKAFNEKVEQYQIQRYISTYVFARKPFPIGLSSGTPLDEIWAYACGNKTTSWNDVAASLHSMGDSIADLVRGTKTVFAPLDFHKYFPIHGMGAKKAVDLAQAFSLNFSGVIDKNLVYSRVYVRRDKGDKWVAADEAKFPIEPATAVRVAAIFESRKDEHGSYADLTGIPMSLQIKRVDPLFTTLEGPVYKTSLSRVDPTIGQDIDDKGLLDYTDEKQFLGNPNAYSCVFFPFYFFPQQHRQHLVHGIKPIGHLGLSGDITYDVSFDLKAGDDGKWASTGKGRTVRVHMPMSNRLYIDMLLNKSFLDNKTSEPKYGNMFKFPYQEYQVGAVYWRTTGKDWTYSGHEDGRFVQDFSKDTQFAWGRPFELLVVFGSLFAARMNWPGEPVRVPAGMYVEEHSEGPVFPVEIFSLAKDENFTVVTAADLDRRLRSAGVITGDDKYVPAGFRFKQESALWAVRVRFTYKVEGKDGRMQDQPGLRPFGKKYVDKSGTYTYRFNLRSSPEIGLDFKRAYELTVPGLPSDFLSNTALATDTSWITDENLCTTLVVEKLK